MGRAPSAKIQTSAVKVNQSDGGVTLQKPTKRRLQLEPTTYDDDHALDKLAAFPPVIEDCVFFELRLRNILADLINDQGGEARVPETRLQFMRRLAAGFALAEQIEARLARGDRINTTEYAALCSTLVRIAHLIGLERTTHGSVQTLSDYLRSHKVE